LIKTAIWATPARCDILERMDARKYRWSKHYESAEEELTDILAAKKITAQRWTLDEMDTIEPTVHDFATQIWCAEGSVVYVVGNKRFSLQPGDTLEIPANLSYEATAGISGCVCYQAPPSK